MQQSVLAVFLYVLASSYPFYYLQTVNKNLNYTLLIENIVNLLNQVFLLLKLKASLRKFYDRHHDLVDRYGISVSRMISDMFHLLQKLTGPFLIHDLLQSCMFFFDIRIPLWFLQTLLVIIMWYYNSARINQPSSHIWY